MRILLQGYSGRMGTLIRRLAAEHEIIALPRIGEPARLSPDSSVQILMDFSSPEGLDRAINFALDHDLPLLSGTTGLSPATLDHLSRAAGHIPILWSSNFSLAAACLRRLVTAATAMLPKTFDLEIVETHHRWKKDSPSGTARDLRETIGREVPIHSLRGGSNPGIHEVHFLGNGENLCLRHEVLNREVFARGALHAAERFLEKNFRTGLYSLEEIFG